MAIQLLSLLYGLKIVEIKNMAKSGKVRIFWEIGNLQKSIIFYSSSILLILLFSSYFLIILLRLKYTAFFVKVIVFLLFINSFYIFNYKNKRKVIVIVILKTWLQLILLIYLLNRALSILFVVLLECCHPHNINRLNTKCLNNIC